MRAYICTKARNDAAGAIAIVLVVSLVYLTARCTSPPTPKPAISKKG